MKKYLKYLFFFVVPFTNTTAGPMDGGDWFNLTSPYGAQIYNDGQPGKIKIDIRGLGRLEDLHEWYFFQGYTIGSYYSKYGKSYFVINERLHLLMKFKTENSWKSYISSKKVNPYFPRWWSGSWESNGFTVFILTVLLYTGLLYICQRLYRTRKWNFLFMLLTGTILFVIIFFLLVALYDTNPQSWF